MDKNMLITKVREYKNPAALAGFVLVAFLIVILGIAVLREHVVAVCTLVILEAGLAALLHNAELWLHGVFVLGMILAGFLMERPALIILCAVIYIAATAALKIIFSGED